MKRPDISSKQKRQEIDKAGTTVWITPISKIKTAPDPATYPTQIIKKINSLNKAQEPKSITKSSPNQRQQRTARKMITKPCRIKNPSITTRHMTKGKRTKPKLMT